MKAIDTFPRSSRVSKRLMLLSALLLPHSACTERSAAPDVDSAQRPVVELGPRDVAVVDSLPVTTGIPITGSLDPAIEVVIKAQLTGTIEDVMVDRGSPLRRGQTLARYDARTVTARAASARAQLAAAVRDSTAADTLYRAGAIAERDFVNASAAVEAARAGLAEATVALERATVVAPVAGAVSERFVSPGEAVQVGSELFTVVNIDALELAGSIPADQVSQVRVGQSVRITMTSYTGQDFEGRVTRIEPVADPGTRQVGVYVRVPNRDHALVGGLFATGRIITDAGDAAVLAVPISSVRREGGETVVYRVLDNEVRREHVVLGRQDESAGLIEVTSGLLRGNVIVVDPTDRLQPGMRVHVTPSTTGGPSVMADSGRHE